MKSKLEILIDKLIKLTQNDKIEWGCIRTTGIDWKDTYQTMINGKPLKITVYKRYGPRLEYKNLRLDVDNFSYLKKQFDTLLCWLKYKVYNWDTKIDSLIDDLDNIPSIKNDIDLGSISQFPCI